MLEKRPRLLRVGSGGAGRGHEGQNTRERVCKRLTPMPQAHGLENTHKVRAYLLGEATGLAVRKADGRGGLGATGQTHPRRAHEPRPLSSRAGGSAKGTGCHACGHEPTTFWKSPSPQTALLLALRKDEGRGACPRSRGQPPARRSPPASGQQEASP